MKEYNNILTERMNHGFLTLIEAIDGLKKEGVTMEFVANKRGFYDMESGETYLPESIRRVESIIIDGVYSEPDARSIIYVLETVEGGKGWVSDAYGFYADDTLLEHLERIKENFNYPV